jgi:WD40 repeat protein
LTKIDESLVQAASNFISILNIARVPFSGLDLSRVKICGAYLRGALLDHTNFEEADLRKVEFARVFINNTNFKGANMKDVTFREHSYIEGNKKFIHNSPIITIAYSFDAQTIATGSGDGVIRLWNAATGKACCDPITGHE